MNNLLRKYKNYYKVFNNFKAFKKLFSYKRRKCLIFKLKVKNIYII